MDLRERDFGSSEGKPFTIKNKDCTASMGHPDAETREQMRVRMVRFVTAHLGPVLESSEGHTGSEQAVVVVAHGIILNVLLRVLRATYLPEERSAESAPPVGWSNTGYTEISIGIRSGQGLDDSQPTRFPRSKLRFKTVASNQTIHLDGLKRTRGGIGSAQFDKKQKTMDSFYTRVAKKAKRDDSDDPSDIVETKRYVFSLFTTLPTMMRHIVHRPVLNLCVDEPISNRYLTFTFTLSFLNRCM